MVEAPITPSPLLTVDVRHTLGSLNLAAAFTLRQSWTVLFGPSAAGKSTLLSILAGLIRPDSGHVALGATTLNDTAKKVFVPPGRRSIGFLTQEPALFPQMDVRRNLSFGLQHLRSDKRNAQLDEVLKLLHIESLGQRMPGTLSGGERQRVALARTLAPDPKLLLLDEPFAALDARLKSAIMNDLAAWLAPRTTPVLYVTHDLAEALRTGTDVITIRDGKTGAQGPAELVLAQERRDLLRVLGHPI